MEDGDEDQNPDTQNPPGVGAGAVESKTTPESGVLNEERATVPNQDQQADTEMTSNQIAQEESPIHQVQGPFQLHMSLVEQSQPRTLKYEGRNPDYRKFPDETMTLEVEALLNKISPRESLTQNDANGISGLMIHPLSDSAARHGLGSSPSIMHLKEGYKYDFVVVNPDHHQCPVCLEKF